MTSLRRDFATAGLKIGNGGTQNRDSTSGLKSGTQLRDVGFNAACMATHSPITS